ncbi:hypothetical protein GWK47_007301 [Chionoecetes opilio]|uniref:Uncharacterized protein n=1 Tax=Chionoecetes opilio TaxID=41210 RepID=A0A8J4Y2Q9_CHIOP|nr:hypothetical protein GWK47_007301 [Chionoecetes opilio]
MTSLARTVLVTGSSRGLGLEFVRQLAVAEYPPKVIIATCRNPDKATELLALARDYQQIKAFPYKLAWQTRGKLGLLKEEIKSLSPCTITMHMISRDYTTNPIQTPRRIQSAQAPYTNTTCNLLVTQWFFKCLPQRPS